MVGGKTMASVSKSNFSTIDDIVRSICSMAGKFMGLAKLNIRNKTQGWTLDLALATQHSRTQHQLASSMTANYRQASLFN